MRILALEGSAKSASAALFEDGMLRGEFFINAGLTHSETLLPMCETLLRTLRVEVGSVERYAVSAGPGSFTGLRIAIATLKGMMAVAGRRCAPVSTLESMAYNITGDGLVCAVMDARCAQVYNALFRVERGAVTRLTPDRALSIEQLDGELAECGPIILVGDGAELCYNTFKRVRSAVLAPEPARFQRASSVARLAAQLPDEAFVTAEELVPVYLRLPQAERERRRKLKGEE